MEPRVSIAEIVNPRRLAVVGASEDVGKFGGRILYNLIHHGYAGELLPINPNRTVLRGFPAYPSLKAAPGPIDLALLAVPVGQIKAAVTEAAEAGVGACLIITAQFGEFDEAGKQLQDEIVTIARAHGMRLIGPNCLGMINPAHRLALSSTATLMEVDQLRAGPVAFVTQSGALLGALFIIGHDHGVGFSHIVSIGNQADVELCDVLDYLVDDDDTKVICLYIEGLLSPQRFLTLCKRATGMGKRVLAIKAGRTEHGAQMARSHTASLAGSYAAFEAACRKVGVLIMDEPEGMIIAAGVLSAAPRLGAGDLGLIVGSGGNGAIMSDRLSALGIKLAAWSPATEKRLAQRFLPHHANNPLDLGAHHGVLTPAVFDEAIHAVAEEPNAAAFMYIMTPQPLMDEVTQSTIDCWKTAGKPVIHVIDTGHMAESSREAWIEIGVPFANRTDDALRALDALLRERDLLAELALPAASRPAGTGSLAKTPASGPLTEPEAKTLLAAYGIKAAQEKTATTALLAVEAATLIGYPVVMKGVNRQVVHKSDLGLVRLGLADAAAVTDAFAAISTALAKAAPGSPVEVVVAQMVKGEAELILGTRYDQDFGPQILVGFGGILVEVLKDVQTALAPISPGEAEAMLRRLTLWPVLEGVRGRPPLDVAAVVDAMVRLSWLAADLGPRLVELDVNPLIVGTKDAIAVDARATIGDAP